MNPPSDTGAWYGNAYVDWAMQGLRFSHLSEGATTICFPFEIFPLRVIKQILCMFFSANGGGFRDKNPDLVKFIKDKEAKYLDPEVKVFVYYNLSHRSRQTGVVGRLQIGDGNSISVFSEISFPPWGYVFVRNSKSPDDRLVEISNFAKHGYNDRRVLGLKFPLLPVYSYLPADFRDRDEVISDYAKSAANKSIY